MSTNFDKISNSTIERRNVIVSNSKSNSKHRCIIGRRNSDNEISKIIDDKRIIFVGGTASGKTTLINAMLQYLFNDNLRYEIVYKYDNNDNSIIKNS